MSADDLAARLLATFRGELEEQIRSMNAGMLALEQNPRDVETLKALFRSAHTLKGAAHAAGVTQVERVCHRMETRLAAARDGTTPLSAEDFELLFQQLDALVAAAEGLRAPGSQPERSAASEPATGAASAGDVVDPASAGDAAPEHRATVEPDVEAAPASASKPARAKPASAQVRVDEHKLDLVLSSVAELLASVGRLEGELGCMPSLQRSALLEVRRARHLATAVREDVRSLRLRPFAEACEPLPRLVRDVASASGKDVHLEVSGEDVEADRVVLDAVREALLHLVRNAIDHGVETPAARLAAGKPAAGSIRIHASLRGDRLEVRLTDDGGGIDRAALTAQLERRGLAAPAGEREWARLLLAGGLSSRSEATTISGRGVGLDSARAAIERVRGTLDLAWQEGRGTTFVIDCPVTLAMQRLVLASAGGNLVAFPSVDVERLERVPVDDIRTLDGRDVLPHEQGPIPVVSLATVLEPAFDVHGDAAAPVALLRLRAGERRVAVLIDEVVSEEELLIHALEERQRPGDAVAGVTLVDGDRVALVLRTATVVDATLHGAATALDRMRDARAPEPAHILVVDDSITTRTLERNVLESAGYRVTTAPDGAEAWRLLQQEGFDLVLSDIEMPRMDGFELCAAIRSSKRHDRLPVVLLTALEAPEQRARGLELGANAYLAKSAFDQDQLLEILRQLVGGA